MNTFKRLALVVTLVVAMGAGFGCAKKQTGADVAPATTADDNGAANAAIERAAQAITDGIVYFDFDKSDIKAESRDMLRQKAELMKAYPSIRVRIEGNCDPWHPGIQPRPRRTSCSRRLRIPRHARREPRPDGNDLLR